MDAILKKYFWVAHVAVVAVCAVFAGRAATHMVVGAYLAGDDLKTPLRRNTYVPPPKVHGKEVEQIIKRDIFCSGCSPIVPAAQTEANASGEIEPQKTTLQLELVSTLVCPSDDAWSMAVVRDLTSKDKDPLMYHKGSKLASSSADVLKVVSKRIYLNNGGKVEYLDIEGAPVQSTMAQVQPPPMVAQLDQSQGDIDKGVTCSGSNCTVERQLVEKLLSNTAMLATAARFVPSIKDGKPNGFKLYAIRPNSIFGKIQLQNGDTIKAINGNDMSTPDAALALFSKLRNASHLSVLVERRGENTTLDYTIK